MFSLNSKYTTTVNQTQESRPCLDKDGSLTSLLGANAVVLASRLVVDYTRL